MSETTSSDKVIHSFADRLALDQAVRALADAPNSFEMERRAQELAGHGDAALNSLIRYLDAPNPTLRGGLGLLAKYLGPDRAIPALVRAAADPRRSPEARYTAVMILERYLDYTIDHGRLPPLPDPGQVARRSAEQALTLAEESPLVLVEYATQLLNEPPEVIAAVIDVLGSLENPQRARLLMAITCYAPAAIGEQSVPYLNALRHPVALAACRTLRRLAPPLLQPAFDRQARKLQLAGIRGEPSGPLRALWSPTNAQGQSILWLMRAQPAVENTGNLLALGLHDSLGVTQAQAVAQVPLNGMPLPAPTGFVHRLRVPNSHQVVRLAEIDPGLGLALANQAVAVQSELALPWPPELVVYGDWVWNEESLAATTWPALPEPAAGGDFEALLRHVAFASWAWDVPDLPFLLASQRQGPDIRQGDQAHREVARRLAAGDAARLLAQRLDAQAQWLVLTHDPDAALALAARQAVVRGEAEHPFVMALALRSLLTAAADRAARQALRLARPEEQP